MSPLFVWALVGLTYSLSKFFQSILLSGAAGTSRIGPSRLGKARLVSAVRASPGLVRRGRRVRAGVALHVVARQVPAWLGLAGKARLVTDGVSGRVVNGQARHVDARNVMAELVLAWQVWLGPEWRGWSRPGSAVSARHVTSCLGTAGLGISRQAIST